MLQELLIDKLSAVLRISADELDVDQPLNHLGIDSLMAVELRNHLQAQAGLTLPIASLLQHPTIRQLADQLFEQLADGEVTAPTLSAANDVASIRESTSHDSTSQDSGDDESAAATLARIDELTEAELDAMLARLQDEPGNNE